MRPESGERDGRGAATDGSHGTPPKEREQSKGGQHDTREAAAEDDVIMVDSSGDVDPNVTTRTDEHKKGAQAGEGGGTGGRSSPWTSDSDTSSDEQFHTPSPGDPPDEKIGENSQIKVPKGNTGNSNGAFSPSTPLPELDLRRLSLGEGGNRKHSLDREDSDESKPTKRKALGRGSSPDLSGPSAGSNVERDGSSKAAKDGKKDDKGKDKGTSGGDGKSKAAPPSSKEGGDDVGTDVDHPLEVRVY